MGMGMGMGRGIPQVPVVQLLIWGMGMGMGMGMPQVPVEQGLIWGMGMGMGAYDIRGIGAQQLLIWGIGICMGGQHCPDIPGFMPAILFPISAEGAFVRAGKKGRKREEGKRAPL